jgi:thiol-disulfide isomerase/thioredoxin
LLGTLFLGASALAGKDSLSVGEAVPQFTLKAINADVAGSNYVSLDNYVGAGAKTPKKAIVVSFFATYCEPCKREMPYLAALRRAYLADGLEVVLVSIDKDNQQVDEAGKLAIAANVDFPVLTDRFNIVARRYFVEKLPCVYVIDGAGKVAAVNTGYAEDDSKKLLDLVRLQLGKGRTDPVPESLRPYLEHAPAALAAASSAVPAAAGLPVVASDDEAKVTTTKKSKKARAKKRKGKRKK